MFFFWNILNYFASCFYIYKFISVLIKFFFCLKAPDEKKLNDLHLKLEESKIDHKLWIEQPENIPTCLVCKPYPKDDVSKFFKKFKLFK